MEIKTKITHFTKTFIIHPSVKGSNNSSIENLNEAIGLAKAIDLHVIDAQIITISKITPATYIGKGKLEEIANLVKQDEIELVIVDTQISPIQQRNIEKQLACKVIDRTALIIEIFANRARTSEGKLQVELAALQYQKTRLVRSWTHLERQRGGFGFTGGPGEKQIESDRRAIRNQIKKLEDELATVKRTRALHRKSRDSVPYPIVALVGYTNAGKTSLFNKLTGEDQYADDKLFATLDPTMRKINLPSKRKIILSDTVGFISDLPTELVAAFRATLEEVQRADIILHIIDSSNPLVDKQKQDVEQVLNQLDVDIEADNIMIVYNKMDLLNINDINEDHLYISAVNNINLDKLLTYIEDYLSKDETIEIFDIDQADGKIISWLYDHSQVISKEEIDKHISLTVKISDKNKNLFEKIHVK